MPQGWDDKLSVATDDAMKICSWLKNYKLCFKSK
jgi:hypothetical protein